MRLFLCTPFASLLGDLMAVIARPSISARSVCSLALAFVSALTTIAFIVFASKDKDKGMEFRGHWGGFGNGSGGWQLSRSLSFLIAALVFTSFLVILATVDPANPRSEDQTSKKQPADIGTEKGK